MTDFLVDEDGDLVIKDGDLVVTESTYQHQRDIIHADKCWWHFTPALGVGLTRWLNESGTASGLARVIRQELERDGGVVESVKIGQDGIEINAVYPQ